MKAEPIVYQAGLRAAHEYVRPPRLVSEALGEELLGDLAAREQLDDVAE